MLFLSPFLHSSHLPFHIPCQSLFSSVLHLLGYVDIGSKETVEKKSECNLEMLLSLVFSSKWNVT